MPGDMASPGCGANGVFRILGRVGRGEYDCGAPGSMMGLYELKVPVPVPVQLPLPERSPLPSCCEAPLLVLVLFRLALCHAVDDERVLSIGGQLSVVSDSTRLSTIWFMAREMDVEAACELAYSIGPGLDSAGRMSSRSMLVEERVCWC